MSWTRSVMVLACAGAAVLTGGCSSEEQFPTGLNPAIQPAGKPVPGLKVTPSQINLEGVGVTATVTVTPTASSGPISVGVSEPPCVSVELKSTKPNQVKYTITATSAGTCSLLVTDGPTGGVQVQVTVAGLPLLPAKIAAGVFHTCGLDVNGAAYCWGNNPYGQLGNSTNLGITIVNPPTAVVGGLVFTSLTVGTWHTCGLTAAGEAWCWGANWSGQLGNPTNSGVSDAANPAPLPAAAGLTFTTLDAGGDHTCGITTQGAMYCWGMNALGQLATTTNLNNGLPNPPTLIPGNFTFTALTAGNGHTCGVTTSGATYCWGSNFIGQLGIGTTSAPVTTPTLLQGVPALSLVVAGADHTCGLTPAGAAWCWGGNYSGELSGTTNNPSPTPVAVSGGLTFTALAAGVGHTCGRTGAGTVYCWGNNLGGALGNLTNFGTSVANYDPLLAGVQNAVAIAAGGSHSCALTGAGQGYCWGSNTYGELGFPYDNGPGTPTPTLITGLTFATP
ncbi:MAG TPA: hypothetical protein VJU17_03835 [Gemmatimonadales bacterium]|nr:hypothetical protein [Gemmatimonadales bacterium]